VPLVFERPVPHLECKDRCSFFGKFEFEVTDRVRLVPKLRELARDLSPEFFHGNFKPARGHRELGAQVILIGLDFRHRQWDPRLDTAHGQPDCPCVD
jgi:hypothetical protein